MPCTSTGVPVQWARARARGIVLDVAVSSKSRGVRKAKILDPGEKRIPAAELPDLFVSLIGRGLSVGDALKEVGRSRSWYESMRRRDDRFRMLVDSRRVDRFASPEALAELKAKDPRQLTFPEFSERYMKQRVFPHLQNVVDLMDRREPSWHHPSMTWMEGDPDLIVANLPPEHAKTTTLTINYSVYRIVQDPSVRIIIVSKSQNMAKKMLTAIKNRLTHPQYADLIRDFAPSGGFAQASDAWTQEMIYVGSETRDVEQKDPTVQALGIGGQIYGARADLIIMDDCIDRKNMREFESQIEWVQSEVMSRTNEYGTLLVVGTRLGPQDLYSEMTSPTRYPDERSPWTYLAMPAVLEFAEKPQDWVTLWPRSDRPEAGARDEQPGPDGLFPKWDGPRLEKKRRRVTATVWARVYQQQQVAEDNVFKPEDVEGCVMGSRRVGLIPAGMPGNREFGMAGLLVVAGLDPATEGHTAATVVGFDPRTFKRYVLDVRNVAHMRPDALRSMVYELTDRYGVAEWVIERNGFQGFLVHDRELNRYLNERGCVVRPHFTGSIKHDEDFGVAAMSALFNGHKEGHNMIELPNPSSSEGVRALIDQLVMWQPKAGKRVKTDTVMSLWMAELACLARVQQLSAAAGTHRRNRFLSKKAKSMQRTYTMADLEAAGAGWR